MHILLGHPNLLRRRINRDFKLPWKISFLNLQFRHPKSFFTSIGCLSRVIIVWIFFRIECVIPLLRILKYLPINRVLKSIMLHLVAPVMR